MKITTKLTLEYLKKNKRRTLGTIVAVILVSILITTLLTILSSYQSFRENIVRSKGNWEAEFLCIKYSDALEIEKNKNIKEISISYDYGMSKENIISSKTKVIRIHLLGYDENKLKNSGIYIEKGRMPENSNEIVIDKNTAFYSFDESKKLDDEIELTFEGETKKYKIVGLAEKIEEEYVDTHNDNLDERLRAITFLNDNTLQEDEIINVSVLMHNTRNIYEVTSSLEQDLKLYEIKNINKVTEINRDELEKTDDGGLSDFVHGIAESLGGTAENQYVQKGTEMPTDKVIYNEELLKQLGTSEKDNMSSYIFILIRYNMHTYSRNSWNSASSYSFYNNL